MALGGIMGTVPMLMGASLVGGVAKRVKKTRKVKDVVGTGVGIIVCSSMIGAASSIIKGIK
jgi:hypothetical protein